MNTASTTTLSGPALDWAVRYAIEMNVLTAERRDRRPQRADHAAVREIMATATIESLGEDWAMPLVFQYEWIPLKDSLGGGWAIATDYSAWSRSADGEEMRAMISDDDCIEGSDLVEAIQRAFVQLVLGPSLDMTGAPTTEG